MGPANDIVVWASFIQLHPQFVTARWMVIQTKKGQLDSKILSLSDFSHWNAEVQTKFEHV